MPGETSMPSGITLSVHQLRVFSACRAGDLMANRKFKRRAPVILILLVLVLSTITGGLIYLGIEGL